MSHDLMPLTAADMEKLRAMSAFRTPRENAAILRNKPHIYRYGHMWVCVGQGVKRSGFSVSDAFLAWQNRGFGPPWWRS